MKFALYVLGALCFAQLAFAQDSDGSTDIPVPVAGFGLSEAAIACIKAKINEHKTAATGLIDNLKTNCLTGGNVSPAITDAVDTFNAKIVAFQQAAEAFQQSTPQNRFSNGLKVLQAGVQVTSALNNLVRTVRTNPALRECIQKEVAAVREPLAGITACLKA